MTTPVRVVRGARTDAGARPPGFRDLFLQLEYVRLVRRGVQDLRTRGRLLQYLVGTDLKRTHADTVMGQVWWLIDPFFSMAIYAILVTVVFQRSIPDAPLFLFAAILPWQWFQTSLIDATTSVTARGNLIRQIQFPKLVLPAASTIAGTITFGFGLLSLAVLYLVYPSRLSPWLLALPVIAVVQYVFTLALAVLFSGINAFYRDVQNLLRHVVRIWFYASPAIYSVAALKGSVFGIALALNPFTYLLTSYRNVAYYGQAPDWVGLASVLLISVVLLGFSIWVFKRIETGFAKIL
ncbi:MAG: ABC transporter permease [Chloroflexi bacterium]|nr:ABC transporter permease [Chloroflexota bacterium]